MFSCGLMIVLQVILFFTPLPSHSETVSATEFREQFSKNMLKGFCGESKFAEQCYSMDRLKCEANVKSSLAKCFRDFPVPGQVADAAKVTFGEKVGRCVGTDFHMRNKAQLRKVGECLNPIEWLGR